MFGNSLPKKILWIELVGLLLIIMFLWADEIFDLPHYFFGAPRTPVNLVESGFETFIILFLGTILLRFSHVIARRLQVSMNEKDRLITIISHDLRSPFTNLIGNSELLKDSALDLSEKERQELAAGIYSAAQSTYALLENLLQWAQLQKENSRPNPAVIHLSKLVDSVIAHLAEQASGKQVVLRSTIAKDALIFADEMEVRSVLQNLLSNAIKFSYPHSEVFINSYNKAHEHFIEVVDQGPGLSRARQIQLLRTNFSLTTQGTSGEHGSGIGLLLVKEFVTRNGGKLYIHSAPGQGSTFNFSLPMPNSIDLPRSSGPARNAKKNPLQLKDRNGPE